MPTGSEYDPEPSLDLPEETWRQIESTLGLEKPDPDLRSRIARYVSIYLTDPMAQLPYIRPGPLQKWFEHIRASAEHLRSGLEYPSYDYTDTIDRPKDRQGAEAHDDAWAQAYVILALTAGIDQDVLLSNLSDLITKAERALDSLPPDKGGRLPDYNFLGLIYALLSAYEIATDRQPTVSYEVDRKVGGESRPYFSPFLDFADIVIQNLAPEYTKGNQALGKAAQRVLVVWKQQRGMDITRRPAQK